MKASVKRLPCLSGMRALRGAFDTIDELRCGEKMLRQPSSHQLHEASRPNGFTRLSARLDRVAGERVVGAALRTLDNIFCFRVLFAALGWATSREGAAASRRWASRTLGDGAARRRSSGGRVAAPSTAARRCVAASAGALLVHRATGRASSRDEHCKI